ncbi:hypothetical protein GJ744_006258 [Endocarpon pusillum]|uniref:Uncharacterized protein n=1 Tax=Endocarpon pusillum TaxID=364733 RepID=A0A8H7AP46_9EURO|nr:hypothetical protein GJ744_006258 [Endocarpon pusillum]
MPKLVARNYGRELGRGTAELEELLFNAGAGDKLKKVVELRESPDHLLMAVIIQI